MFSIWITIIVAMLFSFQQKKLMICFFINNILNFFSSQVCCTFQFSFLLIYIKRTFIFIFEFLAVWFMIRLEKKKWEFCIWENESFEYYFHFFQMANSQINIILITLVRRDMKFRLGPSGWAEVKASPNIN